MVKVLESKGRGDENTKLSEKQKLQKEFWTQLLSRSKGKTKLFDKNSPAISGVLYASSEKKAFITIM
jgi:hypothetical protein